MRKLFNGDNERDEENGTISIIQKKTGARAIIPLVLLAEEIINKYIGKESKYYKERRTELNNDIRLIAQEAGLDEPITYEEDGIVDMVVSLRKDNTPEPTIIRMLDNSGMLKVTFSDVMTCDQFFLTPENFHPAGEYLLHKAERMIEIRERKKKQ